VDEKSTLKTRALRYLARREHSRLELEKKLATDARSSVEMISDVLDHLERKGFLSEARFVEQTIRIRRPKFGSQRIVHELKQKGIGEQLIADFLPELTETELDTAYEIWKKKFGVLPANAKEQGKQTRFMMSRGYSYDIIRQVLAHAARENA